MGGRRIENCVSAIITSPLKKDIYEERLEGSRKINDGWFCRGGSIIFITYKITFAQCKPDCFVLVLLLHYNIKAQN